MHTHKIYAYHNPWEEKGRGVFTCPSPFLLGWGRSAPSSLPRPGSERSGLSCGGWAGARRRRRQLGFYLLQYGTGLAIEVGGCLGQVSGVCMEGEGVPLPLLFRVLLYGQGENCAVLGVDGIATIQGVFLYENRVGVWLDL